MKCPFCKEIGAKGNDNLIDPDTPFHLSIDCSNPKCCCYHPATQHPGVRISQGRRFISNSGRKNRSALLGMIHKIQQRIPIANDSQKI